MTAASRPWMKFYPGDWRADPLLRQCEPLSRYLWLEMIGLMHEADPYGHLVFAGQPLSAPKLARIISMDRADVEAGLAELESMAVFSRTKEGVIFSRRMVRDEQKHRKASNFGKRGAKAKSLKDNEKSDTLKGGPKGTQGVTLQPRGQRPESREEEIQTSVPVTARPPQLPTDVRSVMAEGGFVSPPPDLPLLGEWYGLGATLEQDILPVVRTVSARLGKAPFKLKVFDAAIREKLADDEREIAHLRRVAERNRPAAEAAAGRG